MIDTNPAKHQSSLLPTKPRLRNRSQQQAPCRTDVSKLIVEAKSYLTLDGRGVLAARWRASSGRWRQRERLQFRREQIVTVLAAV